ncbi:MAG: dihydroorotase [Gammaproteobacteria bacterium]|nr:dihydroorotase [Gammaproteobacteria bacterium]
MYSLLIRNAVIARPDGTTLEGDLACEHGLIARIDAAIDVSAEETIDAQGALLLPGVIDTHVHFREPGKEYKEDLASGSRAAAAGGVTSFLEMPNTEPPTIDQASLDFKLARAAETCAVNYGFFIGATPTNLDAVNRVAPVAGIKVFMGCSTGGLLVDKDEDLERIFAGGERLIAVHAEDETRMHARRRLFADRRDSAVHSEIRDNLCALRATERALAFSKRHRRPLHILHLSTHEEIELLRRDKPAWVKAEVIPHHLFLNVKDYERLGNRAQMNPPIRAPEDNAALWQALQDGVIDFLGSDHAPHTLAEKRLEYPNSPSGMPGVETSLPLMLTHMTAGKCTLAELQRWMCSGPAEHYRIPNKGSLLEGWDADLTLVDIRASKPVRNEELFTKAKWSPYEGWKLVGWPLYTVVGGQVAFARGQIRDGVRGRPLAFVN